MKTTEIAPRVGVVDAIAAGLAETARRPWLIVLPAVIDLWLWLAPRVSVAPLLQRLVQNWESVLLTTYTPTQLSSLQEFLSATREMVAQVSQNFNLADALTGGWLGAPSVLSNVQITRMTFISDLVLAPAGLSLQLPHLAASPLAGRSLQVGGLGSLLLFSLLLWLGGQVLLAVYLRWAAGSWLCHKCWAGWHGLWSLAVNLVAYSLLVSAAILLLRLPLAFALSLLLLSANSALGVVALLIGGLALWMTLWFMMMLFFVNEAILLDELTVWRAVLRSAAVVHHNFGGALVLAGMMNLLLYGFRVVWDVIGVAPWGAAVAIVANAFLATSLLLAAFSFYGHVRKAALAPSPQAGHRAV